MKRSTLRTLGVLIVACSLLGPGVAGSQSAHGEYDVKVAFIYNFATLVRWPEGSFADPGAPLSFAILGTRDFAPNTERFFEGKKIGSHPVEVVRISDPSELAGHHIVFVSAAERNRTAKVLQGARGTRLLTIGETEGFAKRGGIINFYREGNKIRFEINRAAADIAGIHVSSRLLRLAKLVTGD